MNQFQRRQFLLAASALLAAHLAQKKGVRTTFLRRLRCRTPADPEMLF